MAASTHTPNDVLILIVVHGLALVKQWEEVIRWFDPNAELTVCDGESTHAGWKKKLGMVLPSFYNNSQKSNPF